MPISTNHSHARQSAELSRRYVDQLRLVKESEVQLDQAMDAWDAFEKANSPRDLRARLPFDLSPEFPVRMIIDEVSGMVHDYVAGKISEVDWSALRYSKAREPENWSAIVERLNAIGAAWREWEPIREAQRAELQFERLEQQLIERTTVLFDLEKKIARAPAYSAEMIILQARVASDTLQREGLGAPR